MPMVDDAVAILYHLGKDKILLDNRTMQSLHAILDSENETLALKDTQISSPARRRCFEPIVMIYSVPSQIHTGDLATSSTADNGLNHARSVRTHHSRMGKCTSNIDDNCRCGANASNDEQYARLSVFLRPYNRRGANTFHVTLRRQLCHRADDHLRWLL